MGAWVLGIAAFLWTVDCVVSTYLTLPARQRDVLVRTTGKTWWQRWRPAWLVRWTARGYRLNFDLHRAGGLWLWIALLVFAWSSVYMNFHDQVYAPLTRMVFEYPSQPWETPVLQQAVDQPLLGWRQAGEVAERLMSIEASAHGFVVERPIALSIDHQRALYHYTVHSNLDFQDKRGRTSLSFNANTGEPNHLFLPTGQYSGLTVTNWLATLHEANVFGLPYRIFVVVLGLAIAMLSITGVYIWLKKRRARLLSRQRRSSYG